MGTVTNTFVLEKPRDAVWQKLVDVDAYRSWNPRLLEVSAPFEQGARLVLTYKKTGALPHVFTVDIDCCDEGRALSWVGPASAVRVLFAARHGFTLDDGPRADSCSLTHFEVFKGALSPIVFPLIRAGVEANHKSVNDALLAWANGAGR